MDCCPKKDEESKKMATPPNADTGIDAYMVIGDTTTLLEIYDTDMDTIVLIFPLV